MKLGSRLAASVGLFACLACTPKSQPEVVEDASAPADSPAAADPPAIVIPTDIATAPAAKLCEPCTARSLAAGVSPTAIAIDDTDAFWIESATLLAAPRAGGSSRKLADDVAGSELALSSDAVFTCRRRQVHHDVVRVPKAGGDAVVVATAATCELAIAGEHLYFPKRESGPDRLARIPLAGGTVETFDGPSPWIEDIAVDVTHVYWATPSAIQRGALAGGPVETFHDAVNARPEAIALTTTHVAWVQGSEIWLQPKTGGGVAQRIANLQDAVDLDSDDTRLFWASVRDHRWVRYDPATARLEAYAVPEGVSSIEADGTTVVFNRFARAGKIELLDTCGCGADTLVETPAIRAADPPANEFTLALAESGEPGHLTVQVSDMSSDEMEVVATAGAKSPDGMVADEDLPKRFRRGTEYVVTTRKGTFPARVTGFDTGSGGSGTIFTLHLEGRGGGGFVTPKGGPVVSDIRDAEHDKDAARLVLPALRWLAKGEGHRGAIGHKHVVAVRGNFPEPHAMLVALVVPVVDEQEVDTYVAALWLADASGRLTREVIGIDKGIEHYAIELLVDVGADGVDEVLFSSSYYEGHYEHLLRWNGDEPEFETIAGDGA